MLQLSQLYPVFLLVIFPLVFLGPSIIQLLLILLGSHVRRQTQQRKELLLERVGAERRQLEEQSSASHASPDDDDWEKVGRTQSPSTSGGTGKEADKGWSGIIGFFHPFWCVRLAYWLHGNADKRRSVTLEVAENGFSGQQYALRSTGIQMLSALSILGIMKSIRSRCYNEFRYQVPCQRKQEA